ncbi:ATP-binding protein [Isorropodon fossajaponicum symbiont]|uniref:ATP-binding protein n=1 Tax=Isorropodon fossajaponicum symbiont TaxID=883811 RepID=UPI001916A8FD
MSWRQGLEGGACFEVQDYGSGIPARHLTRLTERFYRIDKGRSRGQKKVELVFGLAIVQHIAQRHGSVLDIKSELGKGSVFSVCFAKSSVIL